MIMATTFSGEGAEEQAQELVYELRKEYKLPAYSYQKKFEFSKPVEGKGLDTHGEAAADALSARQGRLGNRGAGGRLSHGRRSRSARRCSRS